MATREELEENLSWNINRLNVDPDVRASDDALDVLADLGDAKCITAVNEYAEGEGDGRVATTHLLRVLQRADGQLALVTWSSAGISAIGYRPDEQRFDIGQFSGIDERMGNNPESYEHVTRAEAKDLLSWSRPTLVCRDESKLLPALDGAEVTA